MRTEDQVRDEAKIILGFDDNEDNVQQGTGQITTFNQLGFEGKMTSQTDGTFLLIKGRLLSYWKQNQRKKI